MKVLCTGDKVENVMQYPTPKYKKTKTLTNSSFLNLKLFIHIILNKKDQNSESVMHNHNLKHYSYIFEIF